MTAFAVGALGMIGVPPTAAFLGKWFMLQGAYDAEQWVAVVVIILSTVLNAAYFLPIVYRAFFMAPASVTQARSLSAAATRSDGSGARVDDDHGEAPTPIVIALTITALLSLALFFFPEPFYRLARAMAGFDV